MPTALHQRATSARSALADRVGGLRASAIGGIALPFLLACGGNRSTEPEAPLDSGIDYVPGASWRSASPLAAGFGRGQLERLSADIDGGRYGGVDGLVVVRFGYDVLEHYHGWSPNSSHTMQSVTKSVTSLLYGIAASQADGSQLDNPLLDFFAARNVANLDPNKRALTVRDLLTMRTGMDFWEQPYPNSPLDQMNRSTGDWVQFVLDRPMLGQPGTSWAYNSGAAILVCAVIRERTQQQVDEFARHNLFDLIGITSEAWFRSPFDGLPHCGGGLNLTATDFARIGYLVLRRGRWGSSQVVSESWIDESTTAYSHGPPVFFSNYGASYGYFWWLFPISGRGDGTEVIAASGSGGQWLFVVPRLDLVVVVIGSSADGLNLFYQGVLPSIVH